jgi:hypothetical protein
MTIHLPEGYRAVTPPPSALRAHALPINSKLQFIFDKTMGSLRRPQNQEIQKRLYSELITLCETEPRLAYKFEPKHYEALKVFPELLERLNRI